MLQGRTMGEAFRMGGGSPSQTQYRPESTQTPICASCCKGRTAEEPIGQVGEPVRPSIYQNLLKLSLKESSPHGQEARMLVLSLSCHTELVVPDSSCSPFSPVL